MIYYETYLGNKNYYIFVYNISDNLVTGWDDYSNEFKGHTCSCVDSDGEEWEDFIESIRDKYERVTDDQPNT